MADYGTYASVTDLKALLGVTDTTDDTVFRRQLELASRAIDRYCNRHFYVRTETRYPTDTRGTRLNLDDDLLTVTTLKFDESQDGTYEDTLTATDYVLWPYSEYPKRRIELDTRTGNYTYWPGGIKPIEIAGTWGFGDGRRASPWDATAYTGTVADATTATLTVSGTSGFAVGQSILVGSEQMYVTAIGALALTVVRGINGTTAAAHTAAAISLAVYPEEVEQACFIEATRLWKRKDSAFAFAYGENSMGIIQAGRGIDRDAAQMLEPYRRLWI